MKLISLSLLISMVVVGCMGSGDASEEPAGSDSAASMETTAATSVDAVATINVKVMTVQPETFDDVINVIGTVKPAEDIHVASEEGGKVEGWMVAKGAFVRKGQSMLRLNDDILQAQLKAAEAQYNIAKVNAEKSAKVYADAGAVSELSVTTAQYNLDAAEANVNLLKTRIAKMVVRAPVAGRIDERLTDVGEMVGPGSPVARLIQTGIVKVTAGVPERYSNGMRVGLPVTMKFDALGERQVEGRITFIGATISQSDRTVPVEVQLTNSRGDYKPEMVAEMSVLRNRLRNAVVIPRTALVRTEDGWQVYLAVNGATGEGYIVEARTVQIGPSDQGKVVITEGLNVGEVVITVGQNKVNPGEHVTLDQK
ncbi:MAG: efflux RND transporter periplasmic adaptor subunit [Ignavibacteriae bacterium]|nr:efflux RND transporter periplasmic adaptor subunit [Ignavibacteriota bacterium]MCB9216604.1 efflux RND transporter periplasmic adaptor subunit [Ignavibacteria bacterium]